MTFTRERAALVAAWIGAVALRPDPGSLHGLYRDPAGALAARGADGAIGDLAGAGLWAVCVWIAVASGAIAASRLPGIAGAVAGALAGRIAPRVLRRTVAAALGASIALPPALAVADPAPSPGVSVTWPLTTDPAGTPAATTGPASTAPGSSPPASTAPAPPTSPTSPTAMPVPPPSWPVSPPTDDPRTDRTAGPPPAEPPPGGPATAEPPPVRADDPPRSPAPVVVRTGDTLWSVAATALGPAASPADIAAAWPQWYRANAAAIGSDPDLIRPGLTLHAPAQGDPS